MASMIRRVCFIRHPRYLRWTRVLQTLPELWFLESTAFKVGYAHTQAKPQSLEVLKCLAAAVKSSVDSDYYACMLLFVDRPREKQTVAYYIVQRSPLLCAKHS